MDIVLFVIAFVLFVFEIGVFAFFIRNEREFNKAMAFTLEEIGDE